MLPYRDSRITKVALIVFFVIVLGYAYFEAQGLLFGPSISVDSTVSHVSQPLVTIQGTVHRISSLLLNGQPIEVTETGGFSAPYLLSPGYNRLVLEAKDNYDRTRTEVIQILYTPAATSSATSSPATITASSSPSSSGSSSAPLSQPQ